MNRLVIASDVQSTERSNPKLRLLRPRLLCCLAMTLAVTVLFSGCIRLWGGAGYVSEKPGDRTERVVGFDTAKAFEDKQIKGSIQT